MIPNIERYDNVEELERYLNLPLGTLRNIPIYARVPAVDAIQKVRELESKSLFRPGLYYIVLADLCAHTEFNARYGDAEGDLRVQWFHTAVIQTIGEIDIANYVTFSKTIGDASLIIFSSFKDIFHWSKRLALRGSPDFLRLLRRQMRYERYLLQRRLNRHRSYLCIER
jgi:hypothetical protein